MGIGRVSGKGKKMMNNKNYLWEQFISSLRAAFGPIRRGRVTQPYLKFLINS